MSASTKVSSIRRWWASPEFVRLRLVAGCLGLALVGLGLFGSGAMGITSSYFVDDPLWFSILFLSGVFQSGAALVLLAGRGDRRMLLALLPAFALAAYAIQQSGDWNLMLGEAALSALILTT